MDGNEAALREKARLLVNGEFTEEMVRLLQSLVGHRDGAGLVRARLALGREGGESEHAVVTRVMGELEALAERDEGVAVALMEELLLFSRNVVGLHDVCDAIGLWVQHYEERGGGARGS
jgi:hypothetical protein